MSSPTSVGIADNFAASKSCVTVGTSNHEFFTWIDYVSSVDEQFFRNGRLDDFIEDIFPEFLVGDVRIVLS